MVALKEVNSMFWGLKIEQGKRYSQEVELGFHVSMAALDPTGSGDEVTSLFVVSDGEEFLLCNLKANQTLQQTLDLNFEIGESVTFFTSGKGRVHLTGFLNPDDEWDGEEGFSSDEGDGKGLFDDEAEESSEEEETPARNAKKRKLQAIAGKAPKLVKLDKNDSSFKTTDDSEDSADADNSLFESLLEGDDSDDDSDDEEVEMKSPPAKLKTDKKSNVTPKQDLKQKGNQQKGGQQKTPQQQKQGKDQKTPQSQGKAIGATPKSTENGKNKPKAGVKKVLDGGLIVEELKVGNGITATSGKHIRVNYIGRLHSNNKVFDATNPGRPFKFNLGRNEVIKGWDVGMEGMKVGGKRRLTVPAKLGYGFQKMGPIPPNSTLIFDVELTGVK